ncbi:MAG: DUF3526 domain-containing protein [Gammaproteobacteria bacterium]|nr:DUF3526 domain-containing protein [Gammaproteobacteria bacterium]
MMVARVLRQDWVLLRSSPGLWIALLLLTGVTALAAAAGQARLGLHDAAVQSRIDTAEQTHVAVIQTLQRWEQAGDAAAAPAVASPGALGLSVLETPMALPGVPLAALAAASGRPQAVSVTAHADYRMESIGIIENAANLALGGFDVIFVIVFLMPIVIIALTFDLLSRERELGTLPLVIAQGVSLRDFVLARVLGRGVLVLLGMATAGLVAILAVGGPAALWPDGLVWLLIAGLYGAFWFALALFVNTLRLGSDQNGVILASCWLVLVVVIPALVSLLSATLYPAPSRVLLTTEIREAAAEAEERAADAREAFLFDHPELAGGAGAQEAYFRQVMETERDVAATIAPLLESFADQAHQRDALVNRLAVLSPALLADQALLSIAGMDEARARAWRDAVGEFHAAWSELFADRIRREVQVTSAEVEALPVFGFSEPVGRHLQLGPGLVLLIMSLALLITAVARLRRYPIT